jgi:hypothetical protein
MDLTGWLEWLKSTVPGIVILGAVGSILGALLLTGARKILLDVVPERYVAVRFLLLRRRYVAGYVLGYLAGDHEHHGKVEGYFVYFSYLLARFLLGLGGTVMFTTAFFAIVERNELELPRIATFTAVLIGFLFLIDAVLTFRLIRTNYQELVQPIIARGRNRFESEGKQKPVEGRVISHPNDRRKP